MSSLVSPIIAAIAAIVVAGLNIYFARRIPSVDRNHSKRLTIIELAKKRLEVREQTLQLELAATESGSVEQEQAKLRARQAVQRIISDADAWMKYLEWDSQITQVVRAKQPPNLSSQQISGTDRIFYWVFTLSGWTLRLTALFLFVVMVWVWGHNDNRPITILIIFFLEILLMGYIVVFTWAGGTFSREAQKLKFPRPDAPILDQL